MEKEQCCSHKTKERSQEEYKNLLNRLNRIEGHVITSPIESANTAIITLEFIFSPSRLLNRPSHSFTPIDKISIMTEACLLYTSP